ncbi:hypothetical protein A4G29_24975 [Mycobacterium kansasii]|nr:hypothetical protein A4G29_24975 [Mycobacterium kansasii]
MARSKQAKNNASVEVNRQSELFYGSRLHPGGPSHVYRIRSVASAVRDVVDNPAAGSVGKGSRGSARFHALRQTT